MAPRPFAAWRSGPPPRPVDSATAPALRRTLAALTAVLTGLTGCAGSVVHDRRTLPTVSPSVPVRLLVRSKTDESFVGTRLRSDLVEGLARTGLSQEVIDADTIGPEGVPRPRALVVYDLVQWHQTTEQYPPGAVAISALSILIVPLFFWGTVRRGSRHTLDFEVRVYDLGEAELVTRSTPEGAEVEYDISELVPKHRAKHTIHLESAVNFLLDEIRGNQTPAEHLEAIARQLAVRLIDASLPGIRAALS